MENEKEIVLSKIEKDFGTGIYVSWEDGETKEVLIGNWGCYDKETKFGIKTAFRASVLLADGKEYKLGEKIIDTTSINFQRAIKPYLLRADAEKRLSLLLEISRKGDSKNTVFFIKELNAKNYEQTRLKK